MYVIAFCTGGRYLLYFLEEKRPVFIAFVQTREEEILLQVEKALFFNNSDTGGKKTKSLLMLNHTLTACSCVLLG